MPKKIHPAQQPSKRQHINQQLPQQQQTPKKPRKVVKKNIHVSLKQNTQSSQSTSNFYDTIEQVPTYYLSKQEMNSDPIDLLNSLEQKYQQYGAVKIVVNDAWNAPFTFRYVDKQITTRIQCLQKLKQGKAFQQKVRAYRISSYEAMANAFSNQYRFRTNPQGKTQESKLQQEYWNLVTNSQYDKRPVTVEYAADLSTSIYGSGFPKHKISNWLDADFEYETNFWNLNNISKSPSSLLSICQTRKQKISGISYPWLYMGMMFSTFCWHVEDLFLNSLNYNHKGATKTWYVVPGSYKQKFDQFVQKKFQGNSKKKNILQKIILMIDPKQLIAEGIKVYKANQHPREYVCTFIKAYHAGFSHGFNVGQAVNFLSAKCLKPIQQAQKYYNFLQEQKNFKPKALVLSKQWLIYENIVQNKIKRFSQQQKIKVKLEYDKMIKHQQCYMKQELLNKKKIVSIKSPQQVHIIPAQSKYQKLCCQYCKNYIYLSAIECGSCGVLCQSHINRCECGVDDKDNNNINGSNKFSLWIRQPNKDRMRCFGDYPLLVKAIKQYKSVVVSNNMISDKIDNNKTTLIKDEQPRRRNKTLQHSKIKNNNNIIKNDNNKNNKKPSSVDRSLSINRLSKQKQLMKLK